MSTAGSIASISGASTPKKLKVTTTWAALLASIPPEARDGINVEELLDPVIDAAVFTTTPVVCQQIILESIFGENSDLVNLILECTSQFKPLGLGEQIMKFMVAPSKVKVDSKILQVANFLLNRNFLDQNEFRKHLVENTIQPDYKYSFKSVPTVADVVKCYQEHLSLSHNVTVDEDSGYLLLGDLVTFFVRVLNVERLGTYNYHPQRVVAKNTNPGRNLATDAAIIHLIIWKGLCHNRYQSDVIYEYKPVVHPDVVKVQSAFLIELYLQAHYAMRTDTTSEILACLTDLHVWHYFMLKLDSSQKI